MDPKQQLSQIDPKVKEVYERVMNTTLPTPPPPVHLPPPPPQSPLPGSTTTEPNASVPFSVPVSTPNEIKPQPQIVSSFSQNLTTHKVPEKIHIGGTPNGIPTPNKKSGFPRILYILCGIIFLVVYTVFWLKFFNIPVPFLP